MNRLGTALLLAASFSAAASAQELTASIPFDFTASRIQMPAGKYTVSRMSGNGQSYVLVLRNVATKRSAMALSSGPIDRNEAKGNTGRLVFACGSGNCSLAEVHPIGGANAQRFLTTPRKAGEAERRVAVAIGNPRTGSGF